MRALFIFITTVLLSVGGRSNVLRPRDTKVEFSTAVFGAPGPTNHKHESKPCPPFKKGTFNINAYQLYPENMDWDANLCQVYIGILFNASFGIYDPYKDKLEAISFPGVTLNPDFHVGAVAWDKYTGLASVVLGQGNAFNTAGANISGDNYFRRFDPVSHKFLWSVNITALTQGKYGGFNDIAYDPAGNSYIVGTYPSSILKVTPDGKSITPWYLPPVIDHTVQGYSGIVSQGNTIVVLDSGTSGSLFRFDIRDVVRTPIPVPLTPPYVTDGGDSIRLPLKYDGKVMLVAEHIRGVTVLRSKDASWRTAEYLGTVPNAPGLPAGALVVATTQIGDKLYIVNDWFDFPPVPGTVAGNKTSFPMIDITEQVEALLCGKKRGLKGCSKI
ncbi:hypothetical protein B0H66DRAFT_538595 [Apodospora peruviana]|uniref:Uncharacterized protein n=1 Tax=Apodospora peruviana TaxID=516989 RepID=A0AAE0LY92_9PEZI|nr:hypothetical protein B0H66DRAFT_538595 [Apodospora peruviana]